MNAPSERPPLPPELSDSLAKRFGPRFSVATAVRLHHGKDESSHPPMPPDAVVFAESTEEVAAIVALCHRFRTPVIAFGTGTSLEGHLLAVQGGVCIDLSAMNAVVAVRQEDLDATVQCGVTRKALNAALNGTGLFFPIDPGADASIGGMAATRASGTNAVRYGTMRENVLGMTVVLPDGRILKTGGRARKSAAGYDLTRLMVGSEGTLGIITELTVKLYPVPEAISSAVCTFPTLAAAVRTVIQTIQLGVPVARIELLDALAITAINRHSKTTLREAPTLFFEFHGSPTGGNRAGNRDRTGRPGFRVGDPDGRPQPPVAGSPRRLLRRPRAQAGLPRPDHRCLRADLAPRRLRRRDLRRPRCRGRRPAGAAGRACRRRQFPHHAAHRS
jgi:D-lactate dehydrogenase (cytochrome)